MDLEKATRAGMPEHVFREMDVNGNGFISEAEFAAYAATAPSHSASAALR